MDLATCVISNMMEFYKYAASLFLKPNTEMKCHNGVNWVYTGSQFPTLNGCFVVDQFQTDIQQLLSETKNYFGDKGVPCVWWWMLQQAIPENIKKALAVNNFKPFGDMLGVAAKISDIRFVPVNENITIKKVQNETDYNLFLDVLCRVFQIESLRDEFAFLCGGFSDANAFKHYLGFYQNQAAATISIFLDKQNIVGLYNGATLPEFRKKGLLTQLASTAIGDAKALGSKAVVTQLMAPAMAKGMTERLGMQTFCELQPYLASNG